MESNVQLKDVMGNDILVLMPDRGTICAECIYIVKPSGAIYEPHRESLCSTERAFDWVTGGKYMIQCKDRNKDGYCIWFKVK
jgi:hypothetical protein